MAGLNRVSGLDRSATMTGDMAGVGVGDGMLPGILKG